MGREERDSGEPGGGARGDLYEAVLRAVSGDLRRAASRGEAGSPGGGAGVLFAADGRGEAVGHAERDSVSGAQWRALGLSEGEEQRGEGPLHAAGESEVRRAAVEPGGDPGGSGGRCGADGGGAAGGV